MKQKIVLITGATSGIGKETAKALASQGYSVVIAARDLEKANKVKEEIIKETKNENIEIIHCDLSSFQSIRKCVQEFKLKHNHLNILINNAGTWDFKRKESKDGIENIFQTNFLSPFLLTNLLLDTLKATTGARIVNVASGLHSGTIHFDDIEFKRNFSGMKAYAQSKLAIILFTRLLSKKLKGSGVTANCVHPGLVNTNLARDAPAVYRGVFKLMGKSPKKGAETSIYVATSKEVENVTGEYFENKQIGKASKETSNVEAAEKLWTLAEQYIKDKQVNDVTVSQTI